ncbi:MAG TPA: porin [Thermodesulfobacteriota bacterium]|nr:porin [Thermodesulfobacteriota bacterium]
MKMLLKLLVIAVLVLPLTGVPAKAQSTKQQIQELKQQIEAIQLQNQQQIQQLQQQIELMENARQADQEKIAEIKTKQETVDEDAWYNKFMAQYNKGLIFESADGNWKMRFRIRGQVRLTVDDPEEGDVATNFAIQRLRLIWDGHAFKPWFLYYLQLSPIDSNTLRDLYFTVSYQKEIMPRVGQWKVPYNREELNSSGALQLVERSIVNDQFGLGRDRGAALYGGLGANNNFAYGFQVSNGDGRNGTSVDSNLLYAGRLMLGLGGEDFKYDANGSYPTAKAYDIVPNFAKSPTFAIGVAAAALPGLNCAVKTPDGDVCDRVEELAFPQSNLFQITGDINFKMPFFNVEAEYDGRWLEPETGAQDTAYDQGFRVQAGVFVVPKTWEIAGRFAYIDYDTKSSVVPPGVSTNSSQWAITPGLNYYISRDHRWKVQADYNFVRNEFTLGEPDQDDNIWRLQLQAYF